MISRKTIQKWRKIRKRHPELAEIEEPLKWLITEFDRLHRAGVTKDRIRVTLIGMIAERGLAPQFDGRCDWVRVGVVETIMCSFAASFFWI